MRGQWKALKNCYRGQRAFLLGNGPSLNRTPLHLLANDYCLIFNRANLLFDRLPFTPAMYMCVDERVAQDMADEINSFKNRFIHAFFPNVHPIKGNFKKFIKDGQNVRWLHLEADGFYTDLPKAGLGGTVANVGLQVLTYLGFSPIYLIGVDMDYQKPPDTLEESRRDWTATKDNDCNHFDPRYFGTGRKYHYPRVEENMLPSMHRAKAITDKLGVTVLNAGVGGKLDAFPRVNFRDLFHTTPEQEVGTILGQRGLDGAGSSFTTALPNAIKVQAVQDWDSDAPALITSDDIATEIFTTALITHIPHGPVGSEYLFVRRGRHETNESA